MMLLSFTAGKVINNLIINLIFESNNPILLSITSNQSLFAQLESGYESLFEIFLTFATIQAVFMLGSLYFAQNAVVKTMLTIIGITIFLGFVELLLFKTIVGFDIMNSNMMNLQINFNETDFFTDSKFFSTFTEYAFIPFLWIVSYFRSTEKQV